jgi:transcriptional regulator with XRE-family HTH domain
MDEKPRTPADWVRLAEKVKQRRQQLDMTQQELASAGAPSVSVISRIESGKPGPYDGKIILRLERALRWADGTIDAILNGEEPAPTKRTVMVSPAMGSGKTATPQADIRASSPPASQTESGLNDAVLAYLQAMEGQQALMLNEIKELRQQVNDLQRRQSHQQEKGETDKRASA